MTELTTPPRTRAATTEDPATAKPAAPRPGTPSRARRALAFWLGRPGLLLSAALLAVVLLAALFPALLTSRDPLAGIPGERLLPPGTDHPFGTDQLGRDLYARVVHGSALTLRATGLAVAVGLVAGSLVGLLAGYLGGRADDALMRLADVLLAVPGLLLSLALVTALGFGTVEVAVAVGVTSVAMFARIMRTEVQRVARTPYVEAARAAGVRWYTVLLRHVLPNAAAPVLVYAAVDFGAVVLQVSSLSFLGYGARPPQPEWGALVASGRDYLAPAWWLTTLPGLTIAATVLAANRIARALDGEARETP
ncbi:ABC transporter permease [Streptomyces hydrogenans]|uniref:ABC transporter permease n=1 Tax=Streptomyces hydrogenans TaxID=1873719 RepID=UPI0037F1F442